MTYSEHAPSPRVAQVVERCWFLDGPGSATPSAVLPDGRTELVFHFGSRFRRHHPDGGVEAQPRALLVGQMRSAVWLSQGRQIGVAGIRLRPGAARAVLGMPAHEVTGQILDLCDYEAEAANLPARLAGAATVTERVGILEAFIGALDLTAPARCTDAAVHLIVRSHGRIRMTTLAATLGVQRRTLERAFQADVGLTPKAFARIQRFQRALRLVASGASLPDAAARCGYYDQAHMTGDFAEIGIVPPSTWRELAPPAPSLFAGTATRHTTGTQT